MKCHVRLKFLNSLHFSISPCLDCKLKMKFGTNIQFPVVVFAVYKKKKKQYATRFPVVFTRTPIDTILTHQSLFEF